MAVVGTINGKYFSLSRTKTRSKGELKFSLDGRDRTAQSIKETQKIIDDELGIPASLLSRVVFHGQHATNDLLDASDSKLKEELSQFVPLSLWQQCSVLTRKKTKEIGNQLSKFCGMIELRTSDLKLLKEQQKLADSMVNGRRETHTRLERRLAEEFATKDSTSSAAVCYDDLEKTQQKARTEFEQKKKDMEDFERHRNNVTEQIAMEQFHTETQLNKADNAYKDAEQRYQQASQHLTESNEEFLSLKRKQEKMEESGNCPFCHQKLGHDNHAEETITIEMNEARQNVADLEGKLSDYDSIRKQRHEERAQLEGLWQQNDANWSEHRRTLNAKHNELKFKLENASATLDKTIKAMQAFAKTANQKSELDSLQRELASSEHEVSMALRDQERIVCEVKSAEKELEEKTEAIKELEKQATTFKALTDAFGSRGVQSFVLQNALSFLGVSADSYLSQLSQGTQKLELKLDSDDRISRRALVRGTNSIWQERALSALSGGQWRRTSLALQLAVGDYVRQHCLQSSLVVFDEPLIHLDQTGRSDVGKVFRSLLSEATGLSTLIVILQDLSADELDEYFDSIDQVIRSDGRSKVLEDAER